MQFIANRFTKNNSNISFFFYTLRKYATFVLFFFVIACGSKTVHTYEMNFQDGLWKRDKKISFDFFIADESKKYTVYAKIECMLDYPYQNLYLQHKIKNKNSGDHKPPAILTNCHLFDSKTGKPLGKCWGKKQYITVPILHQVSFERPGTYHLVCKQFMRNEILEGVSKMAIIIQEA